MKKYDFAGWVTKNDVKCSDGITIKHNAFSDDDGREVPLVWNHDHNSPENVLGRIELENRDQGVYGYGYFNNTESGQTAKELVENGDISSLSIFARKLQSVGDSLTHGSIKEVSLVLSGANPGAMIDYVNLSHSDGAEKSEAIINTGFLIHAASDVVEEKEVKPVEEGTQEGRSIEEVFATMNEEQQAAFATMVQELVQEQETPAVETVKQSEELEEDEIVKHNVFEKAKDENGEFLSHSEIATIIGEASTGKVDSLKEAFIAHGVTGVEVLFPEARTVDASPQSYMRINTAAEEILAGVRKVPFARVKTIVADFTEDEARARGYIKAHEKIEQIYSLMKRETTPQTIYKKQRLDRDDIIDVEEYDLVQFTNSEMRTLLNEELARAILISDGRNVTDESKIKEDKIRPIKSDDDFFTIKGKFSGPAALLEIVIKTLGQYRGSGQPDLFIQPDLLADFKLIKATDGRYLFGDIPSDAAMAARLGVRKIIPTTFFGDSRDVIIVNLSDYTVGAAKGGQVTTFDDFDIDFNQMKYLIETRVSGALTKPKSAIYLTEDPSFDDSITLDTGTTSTTMAKGTVTSGVDRFPKSDGTEAAPEGTTEPVQPDPAGE